MAAHIRSSRPSGILPRGSGDGVLAGQPGAQRQDAGPVRGGVGRGRRATHRLLRVPLLAGSLLALTVAAVGLYFLHDFQVERMADSVRRRAESLAAAGQFGPSADYFHRYLQLRPDDTSARLRLAETFDQSAANPRRAIELYEAALGVADKGVSAERKLSVRERMVELCLACGSLAAAESETKQLAEAEKQPASGRSPDQWRAPGLKALVLYRQFRSQSEGVRPSSVEQAFQRVLEPAAGEPQVYRDPRVLLARYEYRLQQRKPAARDDLEAALRAAPRNVDVLLAAAVGAQREAVAALRRQGPGGQTKALFSEARRYYGRAAESDPADPRSYLGLGQLYAEAGDLPRAVETWQAGLKAASGPNVVLRLSLIDSLVQSGRLDEAESVLQSLQKVCEPLSSQMKIALQPPIDLRRGEIALHRRDYSGALALVSEMTGDKEVMAQSDSGRQTIYKACLVLGGANAGLKRWDQAMAAYEQAVALQPSELAPRLALAAACVAAGRRSDGIRHYQQALTVADAAQPLFTWERQQIYQWLIWLLEQESRAAEAGRYRELRKESIAESADVSARAEEEALWNGKLDEALAIAQHGVRSRPQDPAAQLALGTAWGAKGGASEARAAFAEAARLAPDDPRYLQALFQFRVQAGEMDHARETLDAIARSANLTGTQRAEILADGYRQVGDERLARETCQRAIAAAQDDTAAQLRLVDALLRSDDPDSLRAAEDGLRRLAGRNALARRRLAKLLLTRGTRSAWEEAGQLLENAADSAASTGNLLIWAMALAERGGKDDLAKAKSICRQLSADGKDAAPAEVLLLARIEQSLGELESSRSHYRSIVERPGAPAAHVALYVGFLIEHGPPDETRRWLKQLEERAADDVVTLGLRASWLRAQGHGGDIETLVEEWAGRMLPTMDVPRRVQFAEGLANLYQRAGLYACAERWYRRTLVFQPADFEPLVRAIAAQGRIPEALNVCAEAAKNDSSVRPAACACLLLRAKGAAPEDMRHWEPLLDKALRAHRDNVELLNNVASVRIVQGRTDEAIELYRQILRRQAQHFTALNNLATLLSECSSPEKRREAREYIDRAIEWFGPRPELLDTKGTILLGEEKPEQAAGLFKSAASGLSSDPRCCLHLAMAYGKLGRLDQARDALRQARSSKFDRQVLTRLDRERLVELEKKLGS